MAIIKKNIEINASVERVFDFTDDGRNTAKYYDSIHDWKPITEKYRGKGARFAYKTKSLGMEFDIETEITDVVLNKGRIFNTIRGPKIKAEWVFVPVDNKTKVTYILEYQLPIPIIGSILDALFVKQKREADIEKMLQNLKRLLES